MGEIHEIFVVALSLVWFAGATPESLVFSVRGQLSQAIPQFHVERIIHQ